MARDHDPVYRYAGDLVDADMHAGDLVEAKGTADFYLSGKVGDAPIDKFLDQATRELRTADARGVSLKYYFAEEAAADKARQLLTDISNYNGRDLFGRQPRSYGRRARHRSGRRALQCLAEATWRRNVRPRRAAYPVMTRMARRGAWRFPDN